MVIKKTKGLKIFNFLIKEYHKQINIFAKIVGMRPGLVLGYEKVTSNGLMGYIILIIGNICDIMIYVDFQVLAI